MIELNNGPDKPHRKCARIVGDTMGKYHPHGDSSIYGALVNLAQDWSTRYPLVDGHGNFGSVDGDGAAAMRYTEARLSKISMEMTADINKDTVDFRPNFDETEKEIWICPVPRLFHLSHRPPTSTLPALHYHAVQDLCRPREPCRRSDRRGASASCVLRRSSVRSLTGHTPTAQPSELKRDDAADAAASQAKKRRQVAFYPNMNSTNKPQKPFSRSAAKRESVMALGSIEYLQHYFTKTGLAAQSEYVCVSCTIEHILILGLAR